MRLRRAASFLFCLLAAPLLISATGYQVNYGTDQDITEFSTCKNVSNAHASGKAIFVPTNTSTEWSQFYTHAPAGVTIAACGCAVTAGSQNYTTATSTNFTVPCFNSLTVKVWGGGGGGGSAYYGGTGPNGGTGGQSSFNGSIIGKGGVGGSGAPQSKQGAGGAGGTASGGTTNTSGGAGATGVALKSAKGGDSPNGGAGGTNTASGSVPGNPGSAPGGGGGGGGNYFSGGGGGAGGYSTKTYTAGQLTVGASIAVVVGAGGAGGTKSGNPANGAAGATGKVSISWN